MRGQRLRELAELGDAPVVGAFEAPVVDLKRVARVECDDLATGVVHARVKPARQCLRIDARRALRLWPDRRVIHADDFGLDLHEQLAERYRVRPTFLDPQIAEGSVRHEPCRERTHVGLDAGDEQIDAFVGQQHRALEPRRAGMRANALAPLHRVAQADELVGRDVQN